MVLSGAECFIAVLTAFYLGRSCTVLALSFRSALGYRGQNRPRLYPWAVWTIIVRPRQCLSSARALGLNIKMGWGHKLSDPTIYIDLLVFYSKLTHLDKKLKNFD